MSSLDKITSALLGLGSLNPGLSINCISGSSMALQLVVTAAVDYSASKYS